MYIVITGYKIIKWGFCMYIIVQYSRGNTLFYLRNRNQEPINSKVVAISKTKYNEGLLQHIYSILSQTNHSVKEIDFVVIEMNDIESIKINAVCEVSRYLEAQLNKNIIVTNSIETFNYNEYLKKYKTT